MLRLTGGEHKGRSLKWLDIPQIRPTPARVREALFNILGDIQGSVWWDLCAGSGVIGLEALSHGAERVTLVEKNRRAVQLMRDNLQLLRLSGQAQLYNHDVVRFLKTQSQLSADYIYCDPPYADAALYQKVLQLLSELPLPAQAAEQRCLLVLEYRKHAQHWQPTAPWQWLDTRSYGDTCLALLERQT